MANKKKAKKKSKRNPRLCTECGANPAEYLFINGAEKEYLCEPSLEDLLVDLVTNNHTITFHTGDKKPGKLQTIEVF